MSNIKWLSGIYRSWYIIALTITLQERQELEGNSGNNIRIMDSHMKLSKELKRVSYMIFKILLNMLS